ncbi:MlaD family protein, partial [Escherichia coli]
IEFPEAPGVTDASPVRKSGILIGRVVRVELLDEGGALVTAEIERGRRLFNDEVCRINRTLLGDSTLEFVKRREFNEEKKEIPAGTTLHG